jgi:hypothetical protein
MDATAGCSTAPVVTLLRSGGEKHDRIRNFAALRLSSQRKSFTALTFGRLLRLVSAGSSFFTARSAVEEQSRIGEEDFCMLRLYGVAGVGKYQKCGIAKVLLEDDGVD